MGAVAATSDRHRHSGNRAVRQDNPLPVEARRQSLLAITSRLLMSGGEAKSSSAFSARAFPTGPPRCLSRAASSGNASIMPNVDGPNRTANHGFVPGSCSTSGSAERRNRSLDCL